MCVEIDLWKFTIFSIAFSKLTVLMLWIQIHHIGIFVYKYTHSILIIFLFSPQHVIICQINFQFYKFVIMISRIRETCGILFACHTLQTTVFQVFSLRGMRSSTYDVSTQLHQDVLQIPKLHLMNDFNIVGPHLTQQEIVIVKIGKCINLKYTFSCMSSSNWAFWMLRG